MQRTAKIKDWLGQNAMALLWPALSLVLIATCWILALDTLRSEQQRAEASARKEAGLRAHALAQYVTRSVGQVDQVSMQLKHSWEQSGARLGLEDLYHAGMFTDRAFIAVSIADQDGRVRNSTRPQAAPLDVHATESFLHHKNNNSTALRIGVPGEPAGLSRSAIEFTRRLDGPDDSFAGVLILVVDAGYFTTSHDERAPGHGDMMALADANTGSWLARHGDGAPGAKWAALPPPPGGWDGEGIRRVAGGSFADGQPRLLGWCRSSTYPLVAFVGMPQRELVQASATGKRNALRNCAFATVILLLLGLWGNLVARRASKRRHDEEEVQRAYRTATESANDGFYMASAMRDTAGCIVDFEIVDCNERGAQLFGQKRASLVGRRVRALPVELFGEAMLPAYVRAMEAGFYEDERQLPGGGEESPRWARRRLVRVGNGLAITIQDISERKMHEQEMERLANFDALTGLPNRHWLNHFLPVALANANETKSSFALLFIDLDEFKHVNDTQGHGAGDCLLKEAAARLKSLMRHGDHVVRFGGDEFIVLLSPADSALHIVAVAERILKAIAEPFFIGGESQRVGASIGISVFPRDGTDPESLIRHGDIAMYCGKKEGKGQYRFFDPVQFSRIRSRSLLKHGLQQAMENDELQLYYQPRVDAQTCELYSMEALVRWIHPELGVIPPLEFISLAEDSGLIAQLGEVVMAQACAQLAAWRAQGLALVPVSINVSPKQFSQGGIHRQLAVQLARHGLDARLLEVEITESAMMGEHDDVMAELAAIRDLGVKLHLDDFGTGYSSLSQLQKLKMDVLKVDKAFTAELGNSGEGRIFFEAIVSMAHALGMAVVAEGVETAGQLAILQEMRCDEVQGYYIARPMRAEQMAGHMKQRYLPPAIAQPVANRPGPAAANSPVHTGTGGMAC